MGQYFLWYNCDKNQYLDAGDSDDSVKINGYLHKDCTATGAMMTLLASDWKGDRIVLEGDYDSNENHIPFVESVRDKCKDVIWDYAVSYGENMAKYFKGAMLQEIMDSDAERIEQCLIEKYDTNDLSPFGKRDIQKYEYVVNHTKKEYFRIDYSDDERWLNPISYLLISAKYFVSDAYGCWIGDRIGVTNDPFEVEDLNYADMTEVYTDDYFDQQEDIADRRKENERNKDTNRYRYADVYYKGWDRRKNYYTPGNFDVKKGDLVVVPAGGEYKIGKVQSVDEYLAKDLTDVYSFGEIIKVFSEDTPAEEIEEYVLGLYPEKEREFRKRYHMSPNIDYKHHDFNREEIENSGICGCFHYKKIFPAKEVKEWSRWHSHETALCPYCGRQFVIGDASGLPVDDQDFIDYLNDLWFSGDITAKW